VPTISQKELAAHLALSTRQIRNLEDSGVLRAEIGVGGKKGYPWPESNQRYLDYKIQLAKGDGDTDKDVRAAADARRALVDAELAEIELAEKRQSVVSIHDVERMVAEPLELVYAALRNLPARWGAMLVGCTSTQEAISRLKPAVAEAIDELRGIGENLSVEPDEEEEA
jgi:hypothetical protein